MEALRDVEDLLLLEVAQLGVLVSEEEVRWRGLASGDGGKLLLQGIVVAGLCGRAGKQAVSIYHDVEVK